jgi:hypothetical protein
MSADWIEAETDDQALTLAHGQSDSRRFELWERNRLVGSYPAQSG